MMLRGHPVELVVEPLCSSGSTPEPQRPLASRGLPVDLVHPVLAYRAWRLDSRGLSSIGGRARWTERTLIAHCPRRHEGSDRHAAPGAACRCGIYALSEPPPRLLPDAFVWGAVALDGRVFLYTNGLRAERATVLTLTYVGSVCPPLVARAARELEVGLVPFAELIAAAGAFGAESAPTRWDALALGIGRRPGDGDGAWDALSQPTGSGPGPRAEAVALPGPATS
jgi:hypothetical protein